MTTETEQAVRATGGCLCGAVRYEVRGALREVVNCHCSQCLRSHGHYSAYTAASKQALQVIGEQSLQWYTSSDFARRGFCKICGSRLFWAPADLDHVSIAAGSLDRPTGLSTRANIFVTEKGDYYELSDDLERFPRGMSETQRQEGIS